MINLLAQAQDAASTIEISTAGALIAAVVTSLLSGAGITKYFTRNTNITNNKLTVELEEKFATKEELLRIEQNFQKEIARLESRLITDTNNIYTRLNSITVLLNNVDGKQSVILDLIKSKIK